MGLPYAEAASYNNNAVNAATGLSPNEAHLGREPRLPLAVLDRANNGDHQSFDRDIIACCDIFCDRQRRAEDIVRDSHANTVAKISKEYHIQFGFG